MALMDFHPVLLHIEGHVGHVQKIVGKVFLDDISLKPAADNEFVYAVG